MIHFSISLASFNFLEVVLYLLSHYSTLLYSSIIKTKVIIKVKDGNQLNILNLRGTTTLQQVLV